MFPWSNLLQHRNVKKMRTPPSPRYQNPMSCCPEVLRSHHFSLEFVFSTSCPCLLSPLSSRPTLPGSWMVPSDINVTSIQIHTLQNTVLIQKLKSILYRMPFWFGRSKLAMCLGSHARFSTSILVYAALLADFHPFLLPRAGLYRECSGIRLLGVKLWPYCE